MSSAHVAVVLGGGADDRSAAIADLLLSRGGTALVLTSHPGVVDPRLDTGENGTVEIRVDDPPARLESFRSGAVDPDDEVFAALAVGSDGPLAAVLGWEYVRRAAAAGAWDTVVVELDGDLAGVRRIAAAGELAAFVESRWPAHVRFASMAAGDRAETRMREAHRLAQLVAEVSEFLRGPMEVVVGGTSDRIATLAELVRGAVTPRVSQDGRGGYRVEVPVPDPPTSPVATEGDRLRIELGGVRAALPMPALLTRCELVESVFDPMDSIVVARFVPDLEMWPANLVPSGVAEESG